MYNDHDDPRDDDQGLTALNETELSSVSGGLSVTFYMYLFRALSGPAEHGPGGSPGDGTVPGDGYAGP